MTLVKINLYCILNFLIIPIPFIAFEIFSLICCLKFNFMSKYSPKCFWQWVWWTGILLTLFRMGDGRGGEGVGTKRPPTSFSPATYTNMVISPQNFLTFSFNSFATLLQSFKFVPSISPKLLNLNQNHPSKKAVFLVKSL